MQRKKYIPTSIVLIVSTCLTVASSKIRPAVTFITSKRILTANSIFNARIVKALVDICKKWGNFVDSVYCIHFTSVGMGVLHKE